MCFWKPETAAGQVPASGSVHPEILIPEYYLVSSDTMTIARAGNLKKSESCRYFSNCSMNCMATAAGNG